jgi:hypothetical protein
MPLTRLLRLNLVFFPILILGLSLFCAAQGSAHAWKIQSPNPDNPLKQAILPGNADHENRVTPAELQLDCRPDADGPRMNLVFAPAPVKSDADPFEGPGGLGERRKLRVTLANATWPHHFSGYYVESNSFVFSFALTPAEARQITTSSSQEQSLTITVDPAKPGEPVRFLFRLPTDGAPARAMVAPCLGNPHES